MPTFSVTVTNRDFESRSEIEAGDLAKAQEQALKGALEVGTEEVSKGHPFFGAEIEVADEAGEIARYVVAIGASPLQ